MTTQNKKMGLWMLTALVAGNMIGSGIFLLPASLASIGSISILAWIATAIGAFFLAMVFSKLSFLIPKTGGPYVYAREGFGNFIGFQTAYNYWIAVWIGNTAIALASIGYLAVYWPAFTNPVVSCGSAIAIVWILTIVNIIGVRAAGGLQIITTILKLFPLLLIAMSGWMLFHPEYLTLNFNISHTTNAHAFSTAAALTLWSFIGVESATIPAGATDNPQRNIPLATLFGTIIAATIYIVSCTAIMGMIPAPVLAVSTFPFAAAANMLFGHWGEWLVGAGAVISGFGALNGWILLQGQVPMAAADDNLFPKIFAKRNKAGVPAWGIAITSGLMTILLLLSESPNLVKEFEIVILMATLTSVIPYLYTAVAQLIILQRTDNKPKEIKSMIVALIAAAYAFWIIFSSGKDIIFYGLIIVFVSIPLYALVALKQKQN